MPLWFGKKLKFDVNEIHDPASVKILIFTEFVNATYYISFHFALQQMMKEPLVSFAVLSQDAVRRQLTSTVDKFIQDIRKRHDPDLVIFTRYSLPHGAEIMRAFKSIGIPAIYHLDDNLLEIPESLGEEIVKRQGAAAAIEERNALVKQADIVYVSTAELASTLTSMFDDLTVFQGMYAPYFEYLLDKRVERRKTEGITVGYMGSKGHKYDLDIVVPALEKVLDENPHVRFEVFGSISMPKRLLKYGDRVASHITNINYKEFLQYLYELNWDIGLAPLQSHQFNNCKAPTKYIEYTACEIPTIASDTPIYSNDINGENGLLCGDDNWYQVITDFIKDEVRRHSTLNNAKVYCKGKYTIEKLQRQLKNLFQQTMQ